MSPIETFTVEVSWSNVNHVEFALLYTVMVVGASIVPLFSQTI